jgi:hypothetical protein
VKRIVFPFISSCLNLEIIGDDQLLTSAQRAHRAWGGLISGLSLRIGDYVLIENQEMPVVRHGDFASEWIAES